MIHFDTTLQASHPAVFARIIGTKTTNAISNIPDFLFLIRNKTAHPITAARPVLTSLKKNVISHHCPMVSESFTPDRQEMLCTGASKC